MIGRLLNQVALCQLPSHVTLPPEVQGRSRASTRTGRVKTPTTTGKERAEESGMVNVGTILDEAMRHMKLAQVFPGMILFVIICALLVAHETCPSVSWYNSVCNYLCPACGTLQHLNLYLLRMPKCDHSYKSY